MTRMGSVVVQSSDFGSMRMTGPKRLDCYYAAWPFSVFLMFPTVVFIVGSIAITVAAFKSGSPLPFLEPLLGLAWAGINVWVIARRRRIMGRFVVDADEGYLRRYRGSRELESWLMTQVRFSTQWDPFHRGLRLEFGYHYWLVAEVPDGRKMRLGKGRTESLRPVFELLRTWGLSTLP